MGKIAPKGDRYYISKQFKDQGNVYNDGAIYSLSAEQAETFAGSVQHVAFPALEKIELDMDAAVQQYKQQRDQIKTSSRYDQNEPERAYQLQDLRQKLEDQIQVLQSNYSEAVQLTRADLVKKSTQIDVKPEARQRAAEILDLAAVQLSFSANQVDVLDLLKAQIQQQDQDVQTAIGLQFAKLLSTLKTDDAREAAGAVYSQLESPGMKAYKQKTAHLNVLESDHDPALSYRQLSILEGREAE
jgi:hypothetical protein